MDTETETQPVAVDIKDFTYTSPKKNKCSILEGMYVSVIGELDKPLMQLPTTVFAGNVTKPKLVFNIMPKEVRKELKEKINEWLDSGTGSFLFTGELIKTKRTYLLVRQQP